MTAIHAGGPNHYALYLEDPDGIKIELVGRQYESNYYWSTSFWQDDRWAGSCKMTGMTLFHNHDSIDFSLRFIPEFSEDMFDLNTRITFAVYDVFARSGLPLIGTALINFKIS